MWVIFTQYFPDDAGTFLGGLVIRHAQFIHCKQNPPVYRLKTIPHIRKGPAHDNRHGIVNIGSLHLLLNIHLHDPAPIVIILWVIQ